MFSQNPTTLPCLCEHILAFAIFLNSMTLPSPKSFFFFFNDAAPPEISPLSPPDPLPIFAEARNPLGPAKPKDEPLAAWPDGSGNKRDAAQQKAELRPSYQRTGDFHAVRFNGHGIHFRRSEEHTSELQSPCNLVCRLLLEK